MTTLSFRSGPARHRLCKSLVAGLSLMALSLQTQAGTITYDHDCFKINGKDAYLFSGTMHYWRCVKGQWRDVLLKMKRAGINTVQTEVPWNWHERKEGAADFSDLEEFLNACQEVGLWVTVRVGPYIDAEWDNGGYPSWLIGKVDQSSYRSGDPTYTKYVEHWYDEVLPVIKKHLITSGGNVILMQIENEYGAATDEKRQVIENLFNMVQKQGIDIPIVACNTPNAWDNKNPIMAKIINGNNSHITRFGSIARLEAKITESRVMEDNAPTIMLELPAGQGRYSNWTNVPVDVATPVRTDPWDFAQVIKSAWMLGAGLTNFYAFYGGTSFGYGAASFGSTSYCGRAPVQCPMLEPGGLTPTYYEIKLFGQWLGEFGDSLVRAKPVLEAALETYKKTGKIFPFHYSVNQWATVKGGGKWPHIVQTTSGDQAFIFLRDDDGVAKDIRFSFDDPMNGDEYDIPNDGYLTLTAKDMIVLNVNVPVGNMLMKYSTSQIMAMGRAGDRTVVVVYGPEGSQGEAAFTTDTEPAVTDGGGSTHRWSKKKNLMRVNYTYGAQDSEIVVGNVELIVINKDRAYHSWKNTVGSDQLALISNAYFVPGAEGDDKSVTFHAETLPGVSHFSTVLPKAPATLTVNGQETKFAWNDATRALSFDQKTPALPMKPIAFHSASFQKDIIDDEATWQDIKLASLEDLGVFDSGYLRYKSHFTLSGTGGKMNINLLSGSVVTAKVKSVEEIPLSHFNVKDDGKKTGPSDGSSLTQESHIAVGDPIMVYINGKLVPDVSGWWNSTNPINLTKYAREGDNSIVIEFEKFARPIGTGELGKPKGLKAVTITDAKGAVTAVKDWQLATGLAGQNKGFQKPDFDDSTWKKVELGQAKGAVSAGLGWYRLDFPLDLPDGWNIPLKLAMKAGTDALVYLNGNLIGKYTIADWQQEFYLPQPLLNLHGKNTIALVVRSVAPGGGLWKASIEPYSEYSVAKNALSISYK